MCPHLGLRLDKATDETAPERLVCSHEIRGVLAGITVSWDLCEWCRVWMLDVEQLHLARSAVKMLTEPNMSEASIDHNA